MSQGDDVLYATGPGPSAVRLDFGRAGLWALLIGLPIIGGIEALLVAYLVAPEKIATDGGAGTPIAWVFAVLFGLLLLFLVLSAPAMLRRHGMAFDEIGIWWQDGGRHTVIPWERVHAVGVGYTQSPEPRIEDPIKFKQSFALEVFLHDPESVEPCLKRFMVSEDPPRADLGEVRFRFLLPPFVASAGTAENAISQYRSDVWIGRYKRAWHRMPGR